MKLFEQWKQEGIRWHGECKKNRYQKEQWEKIHRDLLSENTMSAFRKLHEKGWTHALTEFFDVGPDNLIRWKKRPAPNMEIQQSFARAIKLLPKGHILQTLSDNEGLLPLWLLRLESVAPDQVSQTDEQQLRDISLTMKPFVGGSYRVGSTKIGDFAYPEHETLIRGFSLGMVPVTQCLYFSIMDKNPAFHKGASRPVEMVSWFDALRFCNALSKKSELECCYTLGEKSFDDDGFETTPVEWIEAANGYRLPTESEWEVAARSQNDFDYAGSANPTEVGWFRENSMMTSHAIMQKRVSPSGLYDLNGNVDEWCWNLARPYEGGEVEDLPPIVDSVRPPLTNEALVIENQRRAQLGIPPLFNPIVQEEQPFFEEEKETVERVNRGGGWFDIAEGTTLMRRARFYPTVRDGNLGFRLAKNT